MYPSVPAFERTVQEDLQIGKTEKLLRDAKISFIRLRLSFQENIFFLPDAQ
jgi:hypothetical protein